VNVCAQPTVSAPPALRDNEAGLPFVDSFTPREFQGHSQVWAIAEDAAGLVYFGNLNQVLVFDGARWEHLPVPHAAFVRGLAVDEEDTLWIGGVDELGYAKTDSTGARVFVSLKDKLPPDTQNFGETWRVIATPAGVWFHTAKALLRWNGQSFAHLPFVTESQRSLAAVGSEIWLTGSKEDWFKVIDQGSELQLAPLPTPPNSRGSRVLEAAPTASPKRFIVATDHKGLWAWDGETFSLYLASPDPTQSTNSIYGMSHLPDGRMGLNSLYAGIRMLDAEGRQIFQLDDNTGLTNNTAICSFPTRDGNSLWVGLANGIARVDTRPWLSHFNASVGIPQAKLFSPTRLHDTLYLPAASSGIYRLVPSVENTAAQFIREESVDQLVNAATTVDDSLVLGTTNGFFEWDAHSLPIKLPDSPTNASAFFPLESRPGTWAAIDTATVRLYQRSPEGWQTDGPISDLDQARNLVEDHDGSWWSGLPVGGVLHTTFAPDFSSHVVTSLNAPEALPEGHGWTRFTSDAAGPLLTCERGIFRFNAAAGRFEATADYGSALADGSLGISGMATDDQDGIWLIVSPNDNRTETTSYVHHLVYGRAGQMSTVTLPALAEIDDPTNLKFEPAKPGARPATLWIAAQDALVRLNLDRWKNAPPEAKPNLLFRNFSTASGLKLELSGGWELPNNDRSLHVQLASPALAGDSAAIYETTFETSSGIEVRTDHNPDRDFTSLGSGIYTLTARARHAGGVWSDARSITFTVLPPWWLSKVALACYFGLAGLIIWAVWIGRTAHLIHRQALLEALIAERTAELAAQNAELVKLRQIDIDEKLAARLAEHQARLEVLRYQLNPHFLFNTLNAICAQIIRSPRTARDTVIRLADFCRLTLHRPKENEDPSLGEEVAMLRAYLEIEQTRLGELLSYSIESDPSLDTLSIPPFLLLPLVENAVKHGGATSEDSLQVRIRFSRDLDGSVLIEVANTGLWVDPDTHLASVPSLGIGLENLRQRLDRYFHQRHEFTNSAHDGWVFMRLRLMSPDQALSTNPR
jgi:hypothetical protein